MAKRPPYATVEDVLRLFDAQTILSDLSTAQKDLIRDAIDDFGSEFETDTGHAFRLTRVGRSGTPSTYEHQGIEGRHVGGPANALRLTFDHRFLRPFDSAEDDALEYRDSRDSWTDITDSGDGDEFTLDEADGTIRLYQWLVNRITWDIPDDRYLRASYRYGAPGGRQDQGGQTTLDGSLTSSATSVSVTNAGHLPQSGTLLIYGDNAEYVDLESVDLTNDTLTVSRGERSTSAASHSDGDTVHYAPEGFRKAVAGAAAVELQNYELFTDHLVDTGDGIGASDRVDHWASKFEAYKRKYSGVRLM